MLGNFVQHLKQKSVPAKANDNFCFAERSIAMDGNELETRFLCYFARRCEKRDTLGRLPKAGKGQAHAFRPS